MTLELVLITGMSGSGKSVALHALEDAGYYCVDNLPPELLLPFVELEQQKRAGKVAIAMDVRSAQSLPLVPAQLADLRSRHVNIRLLFLDATTDTLVRRFSETRRRHPLSRQHDSGQSTDLERDVIDAIEMERSLLGDLREESHIIDTSLLRNAKLQSYIKSLISAPATQLTLMFESFAFKHGVPRDADLVFDVRCLPNPHYDPVLRPMTGRDQPVADWLAGFDDVGQMVDDIDGFIRKWLPRYTEDTRSYLTVAIGCTGGKHRSVYVVETLARRFAQDNQLLVRHRNQPGLI
jgi:UPF0042 nucleotide-binding protein